MRDFRQSADVARWRLIQDQHIRPLVEQRVRLDLIGERFDRAGRRALIVLLTARVEIDRRYAPVLQRLLR